MIRTASTAGALARNPVEVPDVPDDTTPPAGAQRFVSRDPGRERPTDYNGTTMRSLLEVACASHLDALGVSWEYEKPVDVDGRRVRYLPDFLITGGGWDCDLPDQTWVEVKPDVMIQQLLAMLSPDNGPSVPSLYLDEPNTYGDPVEVWCNATAVEMRDDNVEELWKPKWLAEITGRPVLVVGTVNAQRRLSALMTADSVVFSKSQPFVNWRGHCRRVERTEAQARWKAERERVERAAHTERAKRRTEVAATVTRRFRRVGAPRFVSDCIACGAEATALYARPDGFNPKAPKWAPLCSRCEWGGE